MAAALVRNQTLSALDLRNNLIGPTGTHRLAHALLFNNRLLELQFQPCCPRSLRAKQLVDALVAHTTSAARFGGVSSSLRSLCVLFSFSVVFFRCARFWFFSQLFPSTRCVARSLRASLWCCFVTRFFSWCGVALFYGRVCFLLSKVPFLLRSATPTCGGKRMLAGHR